MLDLERTATNSIGLVLAFLITSTKGELVDEINSRCSLTVGHQFIFHFPSVVFADLIDVFLNS